MDAILTILTAAGPIFLAILGGVVAALPPQTSGGRAVWIIAFTVMGLISAIAGIFELRSTHTTQEALRQTQEELQQTQKKLEQEILGGELYGYVSGSIENPKDLNASLPLFFYSVDNVPLRDVTVSIIKLPSDPSKRGNLLQASPIPLGTVLAGGVKINSTIGLGEYQIEIQTRRSSFFEHLKIANINGVLSQTFFVTKAGSSEKLLNVD
jgi:hypothetical protein